jgi:urease accessory protein
MAALVAIAGLIAAGGPAADPALRTAGNFFGGLLHPLLVPAHALGILAAGLLIGRHAASQWPFVAAYIAGLGIGFALMIAAFASQAASEILLAASAASGLLVALARPLPKAVASTLAFAAGIALALDSPPSSISMREANVTISGTFSGASLLLLGVAAIAARLRRDWQRLGARIVGSWIAASAILVLALRLAR